MTTTMHPANERRDRGFTLVELLIVIVILGVLATVAVFAVRGITDKGNASAAAGDRRTLTGAEEAYMAKYGKYGTEAELVTDGLLRAESTINDIQLASGNYTIVAASSTATTVPPNYQAHNGTPFALMPGLSGLLYGPYTSDVIFIVGGPVAASQWDTMLDAHPTPLNGRSALFIKASDITSTSLGLMLHQLAWGGSNGHVFSMVDDVSNFTNSGLSLSSWMANVAGPGQIWTPINDGSGHDVAWNFDH